MTSMTGLCTLVSGEADSGLERIIRLRLTPDCLTVQEEVVSQEGVTNQFDQSGLPVLREISLCRDHRGSFGFSVRGGSENRLPVLVSHVQKGMPAFKTKALFIGDAILRIDQASVEGATHDEVVERLKNAGQQVTLVVKHFREAAKLLHEQSSSNSASAGGASGNGGGTQANRRDSSRRTSSNAVVATTAPESPQQPPPQALAPPPPPPPPSKPLFSCSSSDNLLETVDESATAAGTAIRLNLGGFSIDAFENNNGLEDGTEVVEGEESALAPQAVANPWVLRTSSTAATETRAPIASESFSTVRSNSSTGSSFWQQQHQIPQPQPTSRQVVAVPAAATPTEPPASRRHSRTSSTSSKASLIAPGGEADRCTVFANRNAAANSSVSNRRKQRQSLSESLQPNQQNHCQQQQLRPYQERSWIDVMTVPLKYGRVTRFQPNSDQLRRYSFEVVGLNGHSTGCLTFSAAEEFNKWFAEVHTNIRQLMETEVARFNDKIGTDFPPKTEPLLYMGWLGLTLHDSPQISRLWQDVFLALRGDDLLLFEVPPIFLDDWKSASVKEKVYKCVIRVLDDEELLDKRMNAFFLHCGSAHTFYMSAETVGDVSRLERCWFRATSNSLAKKSAVGAPVLFKVTHNGQDGQLVFDLDKGISFTVGQQCLWSYRFACLKRSYDDRDRKLFLHFQEPGSPSMLLQEAATTSASATDGGSGGAIVKEVEVPDLQLLLIVLHSFLSSKLTTVDPQFLKPFVRSWKNESAIPLIAS